jgi:hypothetical protein
MPALPSEFFIQITALKLYPFKTKRHTFLFPLLVPCSTTDCRPHQQSRTASSIAAVVYVLSAMSLSQSIIAKLGEDDNPLTAINLKAPGVREALERALVKHVDEPMAALERMVQDLSNKVNACESKSMIDADHSVHSGSRGGRAAAGAGSQIAVLPESRPSGLLPLQPPSQLPAQADTLANGSTARIRRRPLTQHDILRHERNSAQGQGSSNNECLGRPILCDNGCKLLADYWQLYVTKWRPLEQEHGSSWRSDRQIPGHSKINARGSWWGVRKPIYTLVEHYMAHDGLSEQEALHKANETFCSVSPSTRNGKRPIKAVSAAFKAKVKELGINTPTGRPRQR